MEPAASAPGAPRWWLWHRVIGGITFGISSATTWRSLVNGGLALFAVGTLLWALGLTGLWSVPDTFGLESWPRSSHLMTLGLAVLAVLLFRYRPAVAVGLGTVAAVVDTAIGGSVGVLVAMWELLFCVGMVGRARVRRAVTCVVITAVCAGSILAFLAERDLPLAFVTGIQLLAVLALPLWWASSVRQKAELADLAAQRADLEAERADLQTRRAADAERIGDLRRAEAVQAERSEIARDLHDAIASRLSTIAIHSGAVLAAPGRDQDDEMRTVRAQALEALQEMRSMIVVLRSDPDRASASATATTVGDLEQISELVDSAREAGLRVRLDRPAGWSELAAHVPVTVAHASYRIVQESLANAAKHAPDSDVRVSVSGDGTELRVVVENSFTISAAAGHPALSAGTGLVTMRNRAEALGGRFAAEPDESADVWHVEATLPLTSNDERAGRT